MKKTLFILLLIPGLAVAEHTPAQTSGPIIHNIMRTQVAPSADALFALQGKRSLSESEWAVVTQKISKLHDAAHRLKTLNTVSGWQSYVDAVDSLSEQAIAQSQDKNLRGLSDIGDKMFNVCYSCHAQFFPKGKNL